MWIFPWRLYIILAIDTNQIITQINEKHNYGKNKGNSEFWKNIIGEHPCLMHVIAIQRNCHLRGGLNFASKEWIKIN